MNHGKCENCGWWLKTNNYQGVCNISTLYNDEVQITDFDSYCTDYINRKKLINHSILQSSKKTPLT